jgi:hypothetical protein
MKTAYWLTLALGGSLVIGCSSLIGLGDFKDGPAGGSAGTGAGGAAGGGTGGSAGFGGSAGAAGGPNVTCKPAGGMLEIATPADMPDLQDVDTEKLTIAPATVTSGALEFVAIAYTQKTNSTPAILVRTVRDTAPYLGDLLSQATPDSVHFRAIAGAAGQTELTLVGGADWQLGQLSYSLAGANGLDPTSGQVGLYPTPAICDGATEQRAVFALSPPSGVRYAVMCQQNGDQGLFVGESGNGVTSVATHSADAGPPDDTLRVSFYTYQGNQHLIGTENGAFRHGSTAAELANVSQMDLAKGPGDQTFLVQVLPLPAGSTGSMIVAARFNTTQNKGDIYSGVFTLADYPKIGTKMPSQLSPILTDISLDDVAQFGYANYGPQTVDMAGPTFTGDAVRFWKLTREGKPLVVNYQVPNVPAVPVLHAAAAPLGLYDLVVWSQQDGSTKDTTHIRGQLLLCTAN